MCSIKLSILTPAYNAEKVIDHAIDSLINQLTEETEWIIINDGSTDHTLDKLDKIKNNPFVQIITSKNGGAGRARNLGIKHARGEWIAFLDADDGYSRNSIPTILRYLSRYSVSDIIYTPRMKQSMDPHSSVQTDLPETLIKNNMPRLEFWTSLYRRDYLLKNRISFYEYREQDVETAFRYLAFSRTQKITVEPKLRFYIQRDNPDSNTHTWNLYNLYYIKALIYADLIQHTDTIETASIIMLKSVALSCMINYAKVNLKEKDSKIHNRLKQLYYIKNIITHTPGSSVKLEIKKLFLTLALCWIKKG